MNDIDAKCAKMDQEIQSVYQQLRSCRGSQKQYLKQRLVQLLKRRKMYGKRVGNYMKHQMVLDNVAFTNENIQNTIDMCQAMKQSNEAQKALMKKIDLDKMEDIRDDMQDMMWEAE